ncbi:MAG TPA: hypothetical protein VJ901_23025 [Thermoanaerobaculia bacterium]|nr:hypothetical protein [Thermoanaerobaculia bacterium]
MSGFLEAIALLLPSDAGGRAAAVSPRDGSYRPFAVAAQARLRIRMIEGPPQLAPGQSGRVVVEVESGAIESLVPGAELDLVELADAPVGILTVLRVMREAAAV